MGKKRVFIDIETYSDEDLSKSGVYRYCASDQFEILLIGYAIDDNDPVVLTVVGATGPSPELEAMLCDERYLKIAHNATFEMACLEKAGYTILPEQWADTMVLAKYAGLPASLDKLSGVLSLGQNAKLKTGKKLIAKFCKPQKKTQKRFYEQDDPSGWADFIEYNRQDVIAEREVFNKLRCYDQPMDHCYLYLHYWINRRGVLIDTDFADAARQLSETVSSRIKAELANLTGLANPNSNIQFKSYINAHGYAVEKVDRETLEELVKDVTDPIIARAITLKLNLSRASTKKYQAALNAVNADGRLRGAFEYYGGHTGRWSSKKVQLQNMQRNKMPNLAEVRELVRNQNLTELEKQFGKDNLTDSFGQLVRTMLLPSQGNKLIVADFSAIEARVLAWLVDETWRVNVFATGGDIYKSSYAQAFGVDVSTVTKEQRQVGKVMELALGYQGSVGAMVRFGAERLGLDKNAMLNLVRKWRDTSPHIVRYWYSLEDAAKKAINYTQTTGLGKGIAVRVKNGCLAIQLPSGRTLFYQQPKVVLGDRGEKISYMDEDTQTRTWTRQGSYGGKLTENVVQAIARDCLALAMYRLDKAGYEIVSHVHDEVIIDAPLSANVSDVERIMGEPIDWAPGLHLTAKGYEGQFYYKD